MQIETAGKEFLYFRRGTQLAII